ncbi:hypothetical protein SUGI_0422840 [Cryptomeria japonica]|uniref:uncharacterized protein LOC131040302 n=1 Tax=Cryptomeria japonica TaxID=3369 RepID=UPI0024089ECF|nr:uncharacterized protein LOC131040302 [Cryptomeria japonica]GLJ22460.1 hypothetical protein SUGI_0422840 [Cryptomeria japonica]
MAEGQWEKQIVSLPNRTKNSVAIQNTPFGAKRLKHSLFQSQNPQTIKKELDCLERYVVAQASYERKRDEQFKAIEAHLVIANRETKLLLEDKRQVVIDLHKSEQELQHYKQISQQVREEKEKMADELQITKKELQKCKDKSEQKMQELDRLKSEMNYLVQEKFKIVREKDQIAGRLQRLEQMVECCKLKADQWNEMQTKIDRWKGALKFAIQERERLSKEKDKIADELKKTHELHTRVDPKFSDIDDSFHCLICMEPWTESQSGEHNICSLACGHFFGRSCITKWIKLNRLSNSSKCPTCQKEATLKDIRNHYVEHISVRCQNNR